MLRQKREKSGTGICHVMQGKESKTCPSDSPSTTLLLDYAEEVFGKEIRKWIENRIKS